MVYIKFKSILLRNNNKQNGVWSRLIHHHHQLKQMALDEREYSLLFMTNTQLIDY